MPIEPSPPPRPRSKAEITGLLESWAAGDEEALGQLFPLVVDELRWIARGYVGHQAGEPSLQTTDLIDEVCVKLLGQRKLHWESRAQFFAFSAELMRCPALAAARARWRQEGLKRS